MNSPLPVSVYIVAHNEERNIARVLASVQGWTSEIVVAINNCTDATERIARSFGVRVEHVEWVGYRDTQIAALSLVRQPWVLALDADEEVSVELKEEICKFFQHQEDKQFNGAEFPRKTWFLGKWIRHGDWYPDTQLRLFRHGAGQWGGSPEHYRIELQGSCKRMQGELHHFSNPTIGSLVGKINVFSDYFLTRQLEKGATWSLAGTISRPLWRFVRAYFLRLGFLDGFPGLFIAVSTFYSTFIRYCRLYEHRYNLPPPVQKNGGDRSE